MHDDNRSNEVIRSQLIGVVLMFALLFIYLNYLAPEPPVRPGQQATDTAAEEEALGVDTADSAGGGQPDSAWPYLPPVPSTLDPEADEVVIESERVRLVLTRIGARIKRAYVKYGEDGAYEEQLVPRSGLPDTQTPLPMGLEFSEPALGDALNYRRWDAERDENAAIFTLTLPGVARIEKRFALTKDRVAELTVRYVNLEPEPRLLGYDDTPAFRVSWMPNMVYEAAQQMMGGTQQQVIWRSNGSNEYVDTLKLRARRGFFSSLFGGSGDDPFVDASGRYDRTIAGVDWVALKTAYFIVALNAMEEEARAVVRGTPEAFEVGLTHPRQMLESGEAIESRFLLYVGPNERRSLAAAWPQLETAQRFFMWPNVMDWFAKLLLSMLHFFYGIIPNYGVGIILLTIVVRMLMFPLTLKQMRSMKKMQKLQPEMEELRKKHAEDPQEMQRELMKLYKERGVNPLGGCLPVFVQMPVFIALYRMLWYSFEMVNAPFVLWINDLSQPERLYHFTWLSGIPLLRHFEYFNLLPILAAVAMIVSTKIMPVSGPGMTQQQRFIMLAMPVVFSLICYNFASGLNLYILTSTVLGIAQTKLVHVGDVDVSEKKKPKKKKHFYDAAQDRKRRIRKETRKRKPAEKKSA